jgi:cytochrome c oxidase subunit 2
MFSFSFINSFCDFPAERQFLFQDSATPSMEGITNLHHDIMFVLVVIGGFVFWLLCEIMFYFAKREDTFTGNLLRRLRASEEPIVDVVRDPYLEIIWTVIPVIILAVIAVPSFALIYALDEVVDPQITLKVIGHQWFWSYEYGDFGSSDNEQLMFDSYMVAEDDLVEGELRNLSVDRNVLLPIFSHIRVLITSSDVLHCWAVPALGVKMDAAPGRLNQISFFLKREGVFYGMCSEICGVNHGFMPIEVVGCTLVDFDKRFLGKES